MSWYLSVIKKYAKFSGRSRRKEYWMFFLFNIIFGTIATLLDNLLNLTYKIPVDYFGEVSIGYGIIYTVYALLLIIPSLAVTVRRLHDQDKSGAWIFIAFVPIIGAIWLLILLATAGTSGPNRFGDDPKAIAEP